MLVFTDQVTVVTLFLLANYDICTVLILCKVLILYLVPGHDGLLVGCEIVINVRTGDHFALGDLCPLQVTYPTAKAETLLALLHCQRHGHLHTVRRVSVKTQHFYI